MTSLAPFIPTSMDVVRRMLVLANVQKDDVVYDLGCGDGRVLFAAIHEFEAKKAVGYELDPNLLAAIRQRIHSENLAEKIQIHRGDLLTADIAEATVITLYLTASGNNQLKPKLASEATSGARIVSHYFPFDGWHPTKHDYFRGYTLYLYTIASALQQPI